MRLPPDTFVDISPAAPIFTKAWKCHFYRVQQSPPKTQDLLSQGKERMNTGQTTGNLFHAFRLKKCKNKSTRKNTLWNIYHTVILNIFFNMKYLLYDNYFIIENRLIRTLHSPGYVHEWPSPGPSQQPRSAPPPAGHRGRDESAV